MAANFQKVPFRMTFPEDADKPRRRLKAWRGYKVAIFTSKKKSSLLNFLHQTFISIPVRNISSIKGSPFLKYRVGKGWGSMSIKLRLLVFTGVRMLQSL
jgi:hypothetical protein